MANVSIRNSKIHGKGLFAEREFKKGETILKWDVSHKISKKEADKFKDNEHLAYFNGIYFLAQEPEHFVNHSCNPNTKAVEFSDVALRDIKKGEELTTDYSVVMHPQTQMKCNCGAKNCKKIIRLNL